MNSIYARWALGIGTLILSLHASAQGGNTIDVCSEKMELALVERVLRDAEWIEQSSAGAIPSGVRGLLSDLFDQSLSDDRRRNAARELRKMIDDVPATPSGRVAARMLTRRVELVEAALTAPNEHGIDADVPTPRQLADAIAVRAAIDSEHYGSERFGVSILSRLRGLAAENEPAASRMQAVIDNHYRNFNVRIVISEPMATKFIYRDRTDKKPIARCVLGAWVTGDQSTLTHVRADIQPSASAPTWLITGDGLTKTNTIGRKSPATIRTVAEHDFLTTRRMSLNDDHIQYQTPSITISSNTRSFGLQTKYDNVPLIRRFARRRASREVARKQPLAEQMASERVRQSALQTFRTNTARPFDNLNTKLKKYIAYRQRTLGRRPDIEGHSTDTHIVVKSRSASRHYLTASAPTPYPTPASTMVVQVHESFINATLDALTVVLQNTANEAIAAINEDGLLGRQTPDVVHDLRRSVAEADILDELSEMEPFAAARLIDLTIALLPNITVDLFEDPIRRVGPLLEAVLLTGEAGELPQLRFADCDPIRVRFDTNEINVLIAGGAEPQSPTGQTLTLTPSVANGRLTLGLTSVETGNSKTDDYLSRLGDLLANLRGNSSDSFAQIQEPLRPDELVQLPDHLNYRFVNVESLDGWLTFEIAADVKPEQINLPAKPVVIRRQIITHR